MSQSLVKSYLHIIFSTKLREPFIHDPVRTELHRYLSGICRNLECNPVEIGGYTDHVHILCLQSKKIALMKLVEEVKVGSSKWMKTNGPSLSNFYWQDGYGAFSVSPGEVESVQHYIQKQIEHHQRKTSKDEFRIFLNENNVEYDERYVWD